MLPAGTRVIRVMPNLPCVLLEGALLLSSGSCAGEEEETLLKTLLSPCGLVEAGPEAWIDAHTGLSGSGVAFVSYTHTHYLKYARVFKLGSGETFRVIL